MPKKTKKMEVVIYLPPGAQEVAPGIWGWDVKPCEYTTPETDGPEEKEIRRAIAKRIKENPAKYKPRPSKGIESFDRVIP